MNAEQASKRILRKSSGISDALWAGLPVLTCLGQSFSGRVAVSLLWAIQLPDLIAPSCDAYETLAIGLATDVGRLKSIREWLAKNLSTCALFDTPRVTRQIGAVYCLMYERDQAGLPPEHSYP